VNKLLSIKKQDKKQYDVGLENKKPKSTSNAREVEESMNRVNA
jgi:hypothetical protein